MVVGCAARGRHLADAQLRLRRTRARYHQHTAACGRLRFQRDPRQGWLDDWRGGPPRAECLLGQCLGPTRRDGAGNDQRRRLRRAGGAMKIANLVGRGGAHGRRMTDAGVTVGMAAVDGARERAIGQRGRLRPHLAEAVEPQPAHARYVLAGEARPHQQIGEQLQRAFGVTRHRRDAHHGGVGPHLDVGFGADPCEHVGQTRAVESAGAVVEQVGGERRQAEARGRIGRRTTPHDRGHRDDRRGVVRHHPQVEAVAERGARDRRKAERPRGARHRQSRAIHGHHAGNTGSDPGRASPLWPRGTTLNATRGASRSQRLAAPATDCAVARA